MVPGLWEVFRHNPGSPGLIAQHVDALNQLRAYNGMMTAVGFMSGVAIINMERNRTLILVLATLLLFLALSRLISLLLDGLPGLVTLTYLIMEVLISVILFVFMPPKSA